MRITPELLIEKGAEPNCDQLATFHRLWPRGGTVTLERCRQAVAAGLDLRWAVNRMFSREVRSEYEVKIAPALAEYDVKMDQAWAEYEAKEYQAWAEYHAKKTQALAEYSEALAVAFFEASQRHDAEKQSMNAITIGLETTDGNKAVYKERAR